MGNLELKDILEVLRNHLAINVSRKYGQYGGANHVVISLILHNIPNQPNEIIAEDSFDV